MFFFFDTDSPMYTVSCKASAAWARSPSYGHYNVHWKEIIALLQALQTVCYQIPSFCSACSFNWLWFLTPVWYMHWTALHNTAGSLNEWVRCRRLTNGMFVPSQTQYRIYLLLFKLSAFLLYSVTCAVYSFQCTIKVKYTVYM